MAELAAELRRSFERRVRWLLAECRRLGGSEAAGASDAVAAWQASGLVLAVGFPRTADAKAMMIPCVLAALYLCCGLPRACDQACGHLEEKDTTGRYAISMTVAERSAGTAGCCWELCFARFQQPVAGLSPKRASAMARLELGALDE